MVEVNWTPLALEDLQAIYDYIAKDSIMYAGRFVDKLVTKVDILEDHPKLGRVVPEFENETIRELIDGSYRIIYKILSVYEIAIVRVHHSSRLLI
ncbi:toxin ParE1/3/4 [Mucilaginibacter sp. UYNi724]